jgi:hypothetical protein
MNSREREIFRHVKTWRVLSSFTYKKKNSFEEDSEDSRHILPPLKVYENLVF